MIRYWFLAHRYLGLLCALIMLLWALSGIVMMYKPYPRLSDADSVKWLPEINLNSCCTLPVEGPSGHLSNIRLEMLHNIPVLRFTDIESTQYVYNLTTGEKLDSFSYKDSVNIVETANSPLSNSKQYTFNYQLITRDQWTVYGKYNKHRPLHHLSFSDPVKTDLYISSKTGEIVQYTTFDSRLWGYLGAVIHWIYPTILRQYVTAWSQTVIWLSILGCFLTITGLYVGIRQFKRRRNGRYSPYKNWALFHHYGGLIFGLVTLTWVFSGLLSMSPGGFLAGGSSSSEQANLRHGNINWQKLPELLAKLTLIAGVDKAGNNSIFINTVRLQWQIHAGEISVIKTNKQGVRQRLNAFTLAESKLTAKDLKHYVQLMLPDETITSQGELEAEDYYYYEHHKPIEWPVFRVITASDNYYYLSPITGNLLKKVDKESQWYRWLFKGLHRLDFTAGFRQRPFWDIFMIVLLSGVSLLCATGCYLAIKRLRRMQRRKSKNHKLKPTTQKRNAS